MISRRTRHLPLYVVAFLASSSAAWAETATPAAAPASAPDAAEVGEARQHFADGLKLYKDGDFDAALVQFERAYAIKPNYKVLYNIAQTYFQLREYVEARDNMASYLKEGGTAIDPERQAAASKDLADLEKRVARVTVTVNVAGATVLVDGKKVGVTPLSEPISVSEGQRTISVEAPNRGARERLVRVAGGEQQALSLDFEEAPPTVIVKQVSGPPPVKRSGLGAGFWSTAIGAVVLGGGAGATGYFALHAQNDNKDQQKQFGVSPSTLQDSNNRAKNLALTSDILSGAAIVCAGVAVVILITRPHHSESAQVGLSVSPGAANLTGSF
jgi:PEGA domain/Tetratricopeptide repeat